MDDTRYSEYCRQLLRDYCGALVQQLGELPADDPLADLLLALAELPERQDDIHNPGIEISTRLFTTYPQLAQTYPRDLLWFFGGECLHLMPDEEIAEYQKLDELRAAAVARGDTLNYREEKAKLLNLQ